MAKKGTGGRKPLSVDEERKPLLARVPESAFDGIAEVVEKLGVSRSDFSTYAAILVANDFRRTEDLPLIPMPAYVEQAMRKAIAVPPNKYQEALLEAS